MKSRTLATPGAREGGLIKMVWVPLMALQIVRASLFFLVFGSACSSQDTLAIVREWLPSAVGDRWSYEEEIRDGNRERPEVERWEQEDVTVAVETVPQGVLIRRRVRFRNNTVPPRRIMRASGMSGESNILIHNDCVYFLGDYGWDASLQSLDGNFGKALATGEALADVCFPLQVGKIWGNPTKGRSLWTVAGLGRKNVDDPASATAETWRLEASLTSGDDNYVWFQKGIGITAARTFHNGTYHDESIRLLRFEPGGSVH